VPCTVIRKIPVHSVRPSYPSSFYLFLIATIRSIFLCQGKNKTDVSAIALSNGGLRIVLCTYSNPCAIQEKKADHVCYRIHQTNSSLRNPAVDLKAKQFLGLTVDSSWSAYKLDSSCYNNVNFVTEKCWWCSGERKNQGNPMRWSWRIGNEITRTLQRLSRNTVYRLGLFFI
jgi:hypothetical protein